MTFSRHEDSIYAKDALQHPYVSYRTTELQLLRNCNAI